MCVFWFGSRHCLFTITFTVQENQDLLIKCISQDLGFSNGRPNAACVIYKCLLHWRSFEVERTSVFDRIIQAIGSAIEVTFASKIAFEIVFLGINSIYKK